MRRVVTGHEDLFGPWMMQGLSGGGWFKGRGSIIGLWDDKVGPIASCLFEGNNEASIMLHIFAVGKTWMIRDYLWYVFYYPFVELELQKIIAPVEETNIVCRKFIEHIGFILEATLKNAAPNGDLLIYTMAKSQCRFLKLKDSKSVKTETPCTA